MTDALVDVLMTAKPQSSIAEISQKQCEVLNLLNNLEFNIKQRTNDSQTRLENSIKKLSDATAKIKLIRDDLIDIRNRVEKLKTTVCQK